MLKSRLITLTGKDTGRTLRLTELPALLADRAARSALKAIGAEPDGSVAALAMQHIKAVHALGPAGLELLMPFVDGQIMDTSEQWRPFNITRDIKDWRNVERLQQAALLLHVGFLIGRQPLDVPVSFRAAQILHNAPDLAVTFCSPHIAAVIDSGNASYRELETVLSIEDCYNIVEVLNVATLRDWHAHQQANNQ